MSGEMCIGAGPAEAQSTSGPRTPMRQAPHHGSLTKLSDMAEEVRIHRKSWRGPVEGRGARRAVKREELLLKSMFPTLRLTPGYRRTLLLSRSERLNHARQQPLQLFLRQNCGPRRRRRPVPNCERQRTYGCRLGLGQQNCGPIRKWRPVTAAVAELRKNHSAQNTGRNHSQLVSITTAPHNHSYCPEFFSVSRFLLVFTNN